MINMEESAIFWDKIDNYITCSHLARRDRDFHFIILMFRDEIEITYCYSHVSRREWETQIECLKVEREKYQSILTRSCENKNSRWSLEGSRGVEEDELRILVKTWKNLWKIKFCMHLHSNIILASSVPLSNFILIYTRVTSMKFKLLHMWWFLLS